MTIRTNAPNEALREALPGFTFPEIEMSIMFETIQLEASKDNLGEMPYSLEREFITVTRRKRKPYFIITY